MGSETYIVIGTGVFGASTALELVRAGQKVITLDRSADGRCAPDAASNDLNKIIRADYSDPHYRDLAKTAISQWRRSDILRPYYHETGVLFHTGPATDADAGQQYVDSAVAAAAAVTSSHRELPFPGKSLSGAASQVKSKTEVQACFPSSLKNRLGKFEADIKSGTSKAYFNPRGGWGEAALATFAILDEAKRLGAQIVGEAHVKEVLFESQNGEKVAVGVRCADGREFRTTGSGKIIVCTGGWAESFMRNLQQQLNHPNITIPTWSSAQCVVTVQLNEEQRKVFKGSPVVLEFASGFYLFEPDDNGLMKIAVHSKGYRYPLPPCEENAPLKFPTFTASKPDESPVKPVARSPEGVLKQDYIPADQAKTMLKHLAYVYPELASAPVVFSRVCYYSESLDENWLIDAVPKTRNLIVATGDSGHAFKFLPLLGNLVCKRIGIPQAGTLTEHQRRVFSFDHHAGLHHKRVKQPRETSAFQARL